MARAKKILKRKIQCEALRYNLNSTSSNQQKHSPPEDKKLYKLKYVLPIFVTECQRANKIHHQKGGGCEDCLNCANSALKARISSSTFTKICPWVAWTVKTWANVCQISESSEAVGGGTSASTSTVATPDVSVASTPIEEGGGGTAPDDTPLRCEEATLKWAAPT